MDKNRNMNSRKDRQTGIEILRIIATFMICLGHVNISIYFNVSEDSNLYPYVCFMELACLYGVNLFGLITGYVSVSNDWKVKSFIKIWFEVLFYTVIGLLIAYFCFPELYSRELILQSIFPISKGTYWYISAYLGMLMLSPVLKMFINSLDNRKRKIFLVILIGIAIYSFLINDIYGFGWGYSASWLIYLYCLGGVLKYVEIPKFNIKIKRIFQSKLILSLVYIFTVISNWALKLKFANNIYYIGDRIQRYDNIFILVGSIALFFLFSKIEISSKRLRKVIVFVSSTCLGIYLIQVNPVYWNQIVSQKYTYLLNGGKIKYVSQLLLHSIATFLVLAGIDKVRQLVFSYCGVNQLINKISDWVEKIR